MGLFPNPNVLSFIQQSNLANSIGKMYSRRSHSHIDTRREENNTIIAVVSFPKSCNCLTVVHSNHSTISPMRDNLRGHYLLTDCLLGPAGNGGVKQRLHSVPVPGLKQTQQVKNWEYSNNKFQARTAARTPSSHHRPGGTGPGVDRNRNVCNARDGWVTCQTNKHCGICSYQP